MSGDAPAGDALRDDPVLADVLAELEADPDVLGAILHGSRAAGTADEASDYDVIVVTRDATEPRWPRKREVRGATVDTALFTPADLRELASQPWWMEPAVAYGRVVLDKTGEVRELVDAVATLPEARAAAQAVEGLDAYVDGVVRSLRAWRRHEELGARLEAAQSVRWLVRGLFALERLPAPYLSRLRTYLPLLGAQGWRPGELEALLARVVADGSPRSQRELLTRVEAVFAARGVGIDPGWAEDLADVKALP